MCRRWAAEEMGESKQGRRKRERLSLKIQSRPPQARAPRTHGLPPRPTASQPWHASVDIDKLRLNAVLLATLALSPFAEDERCRSTY